MKHFKNIILTCFIICFFQTVVISQTVYSDQESYTLSFKAGVNSTNLYKDTISYFQGIFFHGGFVNTFVFSNKINACLEIIYAGKSIKKDPPLVKYHFEYLDIPLYLQYKFSENIKANIGIQYSKYLSSQYIYIDGSKKNGMHTKTLFSNMYNDFSVLLATEFNLSKQLSLEGRYTLSTKFISSKSIPYFGVFQLSFKAVMFDSYKVFIRKNKMK